MAGTHHTETRRCVLAIMDDTVRKFPVSRFPETGNSVSVILALPKL